jgi:hypothetical protein
VILLAATAAAAVAFTADGPLAAIGAASLVLSTLHKVLALVALARPLRDAAASASEAAGLAHLAGLRTSPPVG